MKKLLGIGFLLVSALVLYFWFCWMVKFGCQPLVTHSDRLVPLFHSREFFKKRLQGQSDVFDYCLYHRKCNFEPLPISSGLVIGAGVLACIGIGFIFPDKDKKLQAGRFC